MLRQAFNIEVADGNVDLSLEAKTDESLLVKDIMVYNPVSSYLSVWIEQRRVGYFRVAGELGSHLPFKNAVSRHSHDIATTATAAADQTSFASLANAEGGEVAQKVLGGLSASTTYKNALNNSMKRLPGYKGLLGLLSEKGVFNGYPVAAGQTFTLTGVKQAGAMVIVVYEKWDAGDITKDMPNGERGAEWLWINYGNSGAAMNNAGDYTLNTPANPAEFPNFPFGEDAPSGRITEILGILASDFAPKENDGTNGSGTKYLKLIEEQNVLFDKDRNGLLMYAKDYGDALVGDYIGEGLSVVGNYSDIDARPPLWFPEPLSFVGGQVLTVQVTVVEEGTGQDISTAEQEVAFIIRQTLA